MRSEASPHEQTNTTFVSADAVALPFGDASFDVATFFDVLEHIPDDAAAVAEARAWCAMVASSS